MYIFFKKLPGEAGNVPLVQYKKQLRIHRSFYIINFVFFLSLNINSNLIIKGYLISEFLIYRFFGRGYS